MNENLGPILRWLYPGSSDRNEYRLQDNGDGQGPRIVSWDVPGVSQPTEAAVMSQEAAWNAVGPVQRRHDEDKRRLGADDPVLAIVRALAALTLSLINEVRTKLPPPLPEITPAQFRSAWRNKIDAGDVD